MVPDTHWTYYSPLPIKIQWSVRTSILEAEALSTLKNHYFFVNKKDGSFLAQVKSYKISLKRYWKNDMRSSSLNPEVEYSKKHIKSVNWNSKYLIPTVICPGSISLIAPTHRGKLCSKSILSFSFGWLSLLN